MTLREMGTKMCTEAEKAQLYTSSISVNIMCSVEAGRFSTYCYFENAFVTFRDCVVIYFSNETCEPCTQTFIMMNGQFLSNDLPICDKLLGCDSFFRFQTFFNEITPLSCKGSDND